MSATFEYGVCRLKDLRVPESADPADADARRLSRVVENARAQALAQSGHVDLGVRLLEAGVAKRQAAADASPSEAALARDYFIAVKSLGDVEVDFGRLAAGCATYARAYALMAALRRSGRLAGMDEHDAIADLERRNSRHCAP